MVNFLKKWLEGAFYADGFGGCSFGIFSVMAMTLVLSCYTVTLDATKSV